ncbi:MAG: DNA repair protein RecO [Chloroflexi bacterium]|jgi:DNA repair protein RecO (recombination protein O)|nr:DNA repair protein RecO [Chloroflexota bacterium]
MPRERTYRTEAIILRRQDFGEADRLLTLYARDRGKLRVIAKGARKPQSRKTGHVELFMRTRFLVAEGRNLDLITQAETVEAYPALREDLVRTTYASYAVELLDRFTADEDRNPQLYDLLADALGWFATTQQPLLAARFYELHLLQLTGFRPQLFHCVGCGEAIVEQDQLFSGELGGLLCPGCAAADRNARPISAAAVKVLRFLQSRPWEAVRRLGLRRDLHAELETVMHYYIIYLLERDLKSTEFLHRLRRERPGTAGAAT